jgi:hypothetical protein
MPPAGQFSAGCPTTWKVDIETPLTNPHGAQHCNGVPNRVLAKQSDSITRLEAIHAYQRGGEQRGVLVHLGKADSLLCRRICIPRELGSREAVEYAVRTGPVKKPVVNGDIRRDFIS